MDKVGSYKILAKKQLVVEYYSGDIGTDDLIYLKRKISKEGNYSFNFDTVMDFRDANLKFYNSDLLRLIEFYKRYFKNIGGRNVAHLTSKPNDVAQSILFSLLVKSYNLSYINPKAFSTIEGIAYWFDSAEINKELLYGILRELKTQPNNVYEIPELFKIKIPAFRDKVMLKTMFYGRKLSAV